MSEVRTGDVTTRQPAQSSRFLSSPISMIPKELPLPFALRVLQRNYSLRDYLAPKLQVEASGDYMKGNPVCHG
jgi:hypothetical protein